MCWPGPFTERDSFFFSSFQGKIKNESHAPKSYVSHSTFCYMKLSGAL